MTLPFPKGRRGAEVEERLGVHPLQRPRPLRPPAPGHVLGRPQAGDGQAVQGGSQRVVMGCENWPKLFRIPPEKAARQSTLKVITDQLQSFPSHHS